MLCMNKEIMMISLKFVISSDVCELFGNRMQDDGFRGKLEGCHDFLHIPLGVAEIVCRRMVFAENVRNSMIRMQFCSSLSIWMILMPPTCPRTCQDLSCSGDK